MRVNYFSKLIIILMLFFLFFMVELVYSSRKTSGYEEGESMLDVIMSLEEGAMKRWQTGDPWGWSDISAPEVTYIDPGLVKPVVGLEDYKKYLKQFEGKINYQGSEFINPKVVAHDNLAVLTYNYKGITQAKDGSIIRQSHWNTTEVYCLDHDEWKIIHTHWSFVGQKRPDKTEIPLSVTLEPKKPEGTAGEILALEMGAMDRWRNGDPWGFTDVCASEVTYFDTGTPARLDGLEALKSEYSNRVGKIRYQVMEFIEPKVQLHGNAAVLSYRFFSTHLNPDGSVASRTPWNCTEVYFKIDGQWKIIHTHWSYINGQPKGR
jgi:ketosteroid isomerase-like protein